MRIDSLALIERTATGLIQTGFTLGWFLRLDSDEPEDWLVVVDVIGRGFQIEGFVGRWRGSKREHVRRGSSSPEQMLSEVLRALDHEYATSHARRVSVGVEALVDRTLQALADDNSRLRAELAEARIEIGTLRRALDAVSEAKSTGYKRALIGAVGFVAGLLASIAGGAAEGTSSAVTAALISDRPPAQVSAAELWRDCEALRVEIEAIEGERLPTAD
jgi:hypothetical protein